MLRNQENVINENKKYMEEVQRREEGSFKEVVEALENQMFDKACQMEEKAALIKQYYGQINKMQSEIEQLQEEIAELNEEAQLKEIETEKISLVQKVMNKMIGFSNFARARFAFNPDPESVEVQDVEAAIEDVSQSNLTDAKKERLNKILNRMISILLED